jgi:Co/Zn/Cd efflux system component
MAHCCGNKSCDVTALRESHSRVLWIVLAINFLMFMVEGLAGIVAHSTSLLADALDMLGDASVYGFSLLVVARSLRWQAGAALSKGAFMLASRITVLTEAAYKVFYPTMLTSRRWAPSGCWRSRRTSSVSPCSIVIEPIT